MKTEAQPRRVSWQVDPPTLTPTALLAFVQELETHKDVGPASSATLTLTGSALGIQIAGAPAEVASDLADLSDSSFVSGIAQVQFPDNLVFSLTTNLGLGHISAELSGGSETNAIMLIQLLRDRFPPNQGPSASQAGEQRKRLAELLKEAQRASKATDKAEELATEIATERDGVVEAREAIQSAQARVTELLTQATEDRNQSAAVLAELSNTKAQVQADRDTIQQARDAVGAMEAGVKQFFDDIEKSRSDLQTAIKSATDTVNVNDNRTQEIITKNEELEKEIKEHLLKAVGASLFTAFERRKGRIIVSKWIWASLLTAAVIAQVFVFFWLATHVASLPAGRSVISQPTFLLRATASVPIILFLAYAIREYARERDYEELYGFKSALSFSLSPYLDLVKQLGADETNEKTTDFVVKTIGQIFENPLESRTRGTHRGDRREARNAKDILEVLLKILESRGT